MRYADIWGAMAIALLAAAPVSAEVVDVTFEATDGSDVSGSFFYDTSDIPYGPGIGSCCDVDQRLFVAPYPMLFSYTVSGTTRTLNYGPIVYLGPDGANGTEQFYLASTCCSGAPIGAYFGLDVSQDLGSSLSGNVLTDSGTFHYFPIDASLPPTTVSVSATFTSPVSPTPELPGWTSLLLGLSMTGGLLWWNRRPAWSLRPARA